MRKIFVPLDGTDLSEEILPYITGLAGELEATVLLFAVADERAIDPAGSLSSVLGEWQDYLSRRLSDVSGRLREEGIPAHCLVQKGLPAREIVRIAQRENCDCIAMLTHGRGLLGFSLLGSVAYNVVNTSPIPVLLITPAKAKELKEQGTRISKLLVALDGSELAEKAIPVAAKLAEGLKKEVVLVRVVPLSEVFPSFVEDIVPPEMEKQALDSATAYLEKKVEALNKQGLRATWKLLKGPVVPGLLKTAAENPNCLMLVTTRGWSGLSLALLGSVTISLLKASQAPILVIPSEKKS